MQIRVVLLLLIFSGSVLGSALHNARSDQVYSVAENAESYEENSTENPEDGGLLHSVLGNKGLLSDLLEDGGLLHSVLGKKGLLSGLLGKKGLLSGLLGNKGLLSDLLMKLH